MKFNSITIENKYEEPNFSQSNDFKVLKKKKTIPNVV